MESMYQQLHSLAQTLVQTPWIMENVLYTELMPKESFTAVVTDGSRRITKKCPAIESYIFCPDVSHQHLLPLTACLMNGVENSDIKTPYTNPVVTNGNPKKSACDNMILQALSEYPKEVPAVEPKTEEFIAVVELQTKDASLEATHIGHLPESLQRLRRIIIGETTKHYVELPKPKVRDPILQVGIEPSGRYINAEIFGLTGEVNLYTLGEAKIIPKERK